MIFYDGVELIMKSWYFIVVDGVVNYVLKYLGVYWLEDMDEFDSVGLGWYWFNCKVFQAFGY